MGESIAGGKMKSKILWNNPNTGATNESGFSGLPGGVRSSNGQFDRIGLSGFWWNSTEISSDVAWLRDLYYEHARLPRYKSSTKRSGFSVRCVKD